MQEVSAQLSASMHELRAAELGMTPEQLALQNEIQMAARALAEQGMSQEEISKVLAASLQMREEDIAKSETESKKKNKKKNKKNKKAGKSDDKEVAEDDAGDDDESEAAAPAAETKWNDVE
jgi:methylphosphotriester-DNA--protein-cysteine methyltransferase